MTVPSSAALRARFAASAPLVRLVTAALANRRWEGGEHLPHGRGAVVCPNHVTKIDPVVIGLFLYDHGLLPCFLAKESLFRIPLVGAWLRWTGQVPVNRSAVTGRESLAAARRAIERGQAVVIYPEGTLTRDPALWPMRGRTGAARLALETGAPVIPLAHWGAQELLPRYSGRLSVLPRRTVRVIAGAPVDLSEFGGPPLDRATLEAATARIQGATTTLLARLRRESPPRRLYDPAAPHPA